MLEKKYNHTEAESKWQKYWADNSIFCFDLKSDKEIYSIDTPPPTVNGSLHIGHIFSYTQAEMIARYQKMLGKNVFYPFGFDDNGLPTERLVEKELGIRAKDLVRSKFNELCMSTTRKYETEFKELWQSLGFSVDWNLQYETINPMSQRISQRSFLELAKKGKAYIMETPVLYCTNCQTSIAQAELEWTEKATLFNYIIFKAGEQEVVIATTRPEMLYGCTALFVHPEDERYKNLIGKSAIVPIYNYEVMIMADSRVATAKGTGAVMCCTFGDTTDVEWYKDYKLPYRKVIEANGAIESCIPFVGGLTAKEARGKIIELLSEKGLLTKSEKIEHSVAIHERCSCETEIIQSKQWYIDVLSIKDRLLEAADEIKWYPESMKIRYLSWVNNLKWDWCISRQRYFGVPFPVWYCSECGELMLADESELPINPLEKKPTRACSCGSKSFAPEEAVFDTWATSSVTPLINARWREKDDRSDSLLPMSMRTQAHEIIRTWAFYTIAKSLYHTGQIPWKEIMICGFVMAKKGEKISKSKDNSSFTPSEIIRQYSADSVRYWAANARLGTDIMFELEELQGTKRFITKLWNAAKFSLMHLQDFDGANREHSELKPIDKWILERIREVQVKAKELLNKYEVGAARQIIDDFFWNDFCDNYLEIVKDRLYKPELHGINERKSGQYALYNTLLILLKLYAIYVPHITEEIYQAFFKGFEGALSIHQLLWDKDDAIDNELIDFGASIANTLKEVRRYKSEKNLSLRAELSELELIVKKEQLQMHIETLMDIRSCTAADNVTIKEGLDYEIKIKE